MADSAPDGPRSSAPTIALPNAPVLAERIDQLQQQLDRDSSAAPSSGRLSAGDSRRPEWCVDFGSRLKPMTTFELWIAVGNGSVGLDTRVWRDGMDRWRSVRKIPELLHALPDSVRSGKVAGEITGTPPPAVRERSASDITPVGGSEVAPRRERSRGRGVQHEQRAGGAWGWQGISSRLAAHRSSLLSIAIGAAVGCGALLAALASTHRIEPLAGAWTSPAAAVSVMRPIGPYARKLSGRVQRWAAPPRVDLDLTGEDLFSGREAGPARRSLISPRERDPGQRRARRGSRP